MNLETVEQIVALISDYPVSEVTLEQDGQRIHVRRSALPTSPPFVPIQTALSDSRNSAPSEIPIHSETAPTADDAQSRQESLVLLTAPMVGVFHHSGQPIRYGGSISAGQIVGSIESMKLMNDVLADRGGQVIEVLIEDGTPVEYGQPLFRLTGA
jgi:acetyl-CoA carboxylase biotin carboxyl carrier protein